MKLLRTFPKVAFEFGLASWRWLGLREQTPRFATCFGDIFLESLDGWWFLDTVEGTLELRWTSAVTMYAELESPEGRATYLMDDLVRDARSRGIHLGEEDVYTFNPHPALGGELGVNGLGTMRFELAVNWVGQMHDQVLHGSGEINLPPMPDDGRRGAAPQVAAAWDSAWSRDETFDVPFEQYLATTTFAAVATPRHGTGGHPASSPGAPGRGPGTAGARPYAAQEQPLDPPGGPASDPLAWPGQTTPAGHWSDSSPVPAAPEQYDYSAHEVPPDPYGADAGGTQSATHYAGQGWSAPEPAPGTTGPAYPDDTAAAWGAPGTDAGWADAGWSDDRLPEQHLPAGHPADAGPGGTGWADPGWANPGWGAQAPAVAAGGSPQQAPPADPFTAWDDLWGKR
ncbi:T6SS immunity protein Tdi1 domain-containing protein [Promicromonospora sp. NPDC050880]|uniref:T6SS immunity protein Tdi1 domain-containing protein n=1 Tax=Promicromonospora sp. NPDC050880 TaxID=3364406 RepID=UPI0037905F7E